MEIAENSRCFLETPLREADNQLTGPSKVCVLWREMYRLASAKALIQRFLEIFSVLVPKEKEQRAGN